MKIIPLATNHILLELDNGVVIDINDGSKYSSLALKIDQILTTLPRSFKIDRAGAKEISIVFYA